MHKSITSTSVIPARWLTPNPQTRASQLPNSSAGALPGHQKATSEEALALELGR